MVYKFLDVPVELAKYLLSHIFFDFAVADLWERLMDIKSIILLAKRALLSPRMVIEHFRVLVDSYSDVITFLPQVRANNTFALDTGLRFRFFNLVNLIILKYWDRHHLWLWVISHHHSAKRKVFGIIPIVHRVNLDLSATILCVKDRRQLCLPLIDHTMVP